MSEGSESDLSLSQASAAEEERRAAREAARPWLIFLCLLDDLNKAYKPHGLVVPGLLSARSMFGMWFRALT